MISESKHDVKSEVKKPEITQSQAVITKPYLGGIKGVPVEPGQDWRHIPRNVALQKFHEHENFWKTRFTQQNPTTQGSMDWTRG